MDAVPTLASSRSSLSQRVPAPTCVCFAPCAAACLSGQGLGVGVGFGVRSGAGAGVRSGLGVGSGAGVGSGVGVGLGVGFGLGVASGAGVGSGVGVGLAVGSGVGVRSTGVGTGIVFGSNGGEGVARTSGVRVPAGTVPRIGSAVANGRGVIGTARRPTLGWSAGAPIGAGGSSATSGTWGDPSGSEDGAGVADGTFEGGELKNGNGVPPEGSTNGEVCRVGPARSSLGHPRRKTTTSAAIAAPTKTTVPVIGFALPCGLLIRSSSWG